VNKMQVLKYGTKVVQFREFDSKSCTFTTLAATICREPDIS